MEDPLPKVLYETRHHASRPYTPNYPPHQASDGVKHSFFPFFPAQAMIKLKEKLKEYRYNQPRKFRRLISLYISPRGEHVAVASGNHLTIFQKADNYHEPSGSFTNPLLTTFSTGTWSESHDVLGVVDDNETLYFVKTNGEEIARITGRQLKVPSSIIGLIAWEDFDTQRSYLCKFIIITSDGSLQLMEIGRDPSISMLSVCISNNELAMKSQFPSRIFCCDFDPDLSVLVIIGSSVNVSLNSSRYPGPCHLSLWRISQNLDVEPLFSIHFGGFYVKPNGHRGQMSYRKLLISPLAQFVATLDVTGCLYIFKLDKKNFTVSNFDISEEDNTKVENCFPTEKMYFQNDVWDFTWWSDHILIIAKSCGIVTMIDILSGRKLQEHGPKYLLPIFERAKHVPGHLFLLGSTVYKQKFDSSKDTDYDDCNDFNLITEDADNHCDISRLKWHLETFSERSVSEMYNILISSKKYQEALEFADCYALDKDEVLKSQWLNSKQGIEEIDTLLADVKDKVFVLSECVNKVGLTEDSVKALLSHGLQITDQCRFSESEDQDDKQNWNFRLARLQILQFRDKLETYLGINMGRYSMEEYRKFRMVPMHEVALILAQSGKIGALNLLFKRHPYSLYSTMLEVLTAIPETIPVQTYGQLLPGKSPPTSIAVREKDWVECTKMIRFISQSYDNIGIAMQVKTEPILKQSSGLRWPSTNELVLWYTNRARDVDTFSGQLDNCLNLLDFAIRKGISELQQVFEDVLYLHQLIYSEDYGEGFSINVVEWQQLLDYEKFKMMLKGVKEENVIKRLLEKAMPFMRKRSRGIPSIACSSVTDSKTCVDTDSTESFLVRWMKEIGSENKLDICLIIFDEVCRNFEGYDLFTNEFEAISCALQCIYLCPATDRWSIMAGILTKLPQIPDTEVSGDLEKRLKLAEGHIDAGRLLSFYQVPKPLNFFLEAHSDGKGVKQIFRLILSKFSRRQPVRSDIDWANMWRDMQYLRDRAFPFLDLEYMLFEFCRGLLKAGKFSLARNYLRGTSSVSLAPDKAENLVIQAAKEYFFAAPSLSCPEIWKAKECLNLFPSRNTRAELDIIEVITIKLPSLGVTILPMQFRQIKDPLEVFKKAISCQTGAYLHVDELIEVAKLLGLNSTDDISAVQEAIAREAAVAGDLQLAFDLCLVLAKKGHGSIWDLCAAIARGPALENMSITSRKQLLGFALSHCDEESISELLYAWKDLDMQGKCETLMNLTGRSSPNFSFQSSFHSTQNTVDEKQCYTFIQDNCEVQEMEMEKLRESIYDVAKKLPVENKMSLESFFGNDGKVVVFAASQLPWLIELGIKTENEKEMIPGNKYVSVRTQAMVTILSWLARNGFVPTDRLIASLAQSVIEPPVTKEEDLIGGLLLLNLMDAFNGVEVIEEQLRERVNYLEVCSITNVGMTYCSLHNSAVECESPAQRRELLMRKFRGKHLSPSSDENIKLGKVQSSFWRQWKMKLEEQKRVADHSRTLENILPGVETARVLSGDSIYITSVVHSLIESVMLEKKHIIKDVLKLADTYGLERIKVLLKYVTSILLSEIWSNDDIMVEIAEFRHELIDCAAETIKAISMSVYSTIDGYNKQRLSYVYGLLYDCYSKLERTGESVSTAHHSEIRVTSFGFSHFFEVVGKECKNVAFIKNLNYKNIVGLGDLNFKCFSQEVYANVDENNLEALAKMVESLLSLYVEPVPEGLISWQDVYKFFVLNLLTTFETRFRTDFNFKSPEDLQDFVNQLEHSLDSCRVHIRFLTCSDAVHTLKRYFTIIIPLYSSCAEVPDNSAWQDCLITLLHFWIRLTFELKEVIDHGKEKENSMCSPDCLTNCLEVFIRLVKEDSISPSQGWATTVNYAKNGLIGDLSLEAFMFCKAMVLSACGFGAVREVFSETVSQLSTSSIEMEVQDLPHLYVKVFETILDELLSCDHEHHNLHHLLSSLSKLESDLEELRRVRQLVWERMAQFSDDLFIPSSIRVYVLELMQFIADRSIKGFSAEIQYNVQSWEGWDAFQYKSKYSETVGAAPNFSDHKDASCRFTSTLVSLKSSRLASMISSSLEVVSDDFLTVETTVACFLRLCGAATNDSHVDILLDILAEWEGLFVIESNEISSAEKNGENEWNNDGWDEGWESFQEIKSTEKEKPEIFTSIHPLHLCWVEIFKVLISLSRFTTILNLFDQFLTKQNGILLDEDDTRCLAHLLMDKDCFACLKMVLLLPYEALRFECLDSVEVKLKRGLSDASSGDIQLLILLLSSGVISTIVTNPSYDSIFSYLCHLVGKFCHHFQAIQLSKLSLMQSYDPQNKSLDSLHLFRKVVFPCLVSELVKADQHVLAAFIVTKLMHTNSSFCLINIAEASLCRYLERELHISEDDNDEVWQTEICLEKTLRNSVSNLRGTLRSLIESALRLL